MVESIKKRQLSEIKEGFLSAGDAENLLGFKHNSAKKGYLWWQLLKEELGCGCARVLSELMGGRASVDENGRIQVQVFAENMGFILNLKH